MAQYIPLEQLVAEIERRMDFASYMDFERYSTLESILSFVKEELEVKEVDLEQEIDDYIGTKEVWEIQEAPLTSIENAAKHFFELGLQSQSEEKIVAEEEGTCNKILNRIVGKSWNIICPVYKMNVNNGEKVKIRIIKGE